MSIGNRIKEIRDSLNLSQKKFAEKFNLKTSSCSMWEKNKNIPPAIVLLKMSEMSGKSMEWILTGEERGLSRDETTEKIANMLADMSDDEKQDMLRYIEKEKLLTDLLKKCGKK